jgi:SagB-type dehydrogenase family enzyme
VRRGGQALDWETKPLPFKLYPEVEPLRLPTGLPSPALETFAAMRGGPIERPAPLDLDRLAAALFFSAGVMRMKTYPGGGQIHFRAAPSTGALYQTEVYVVAGAVEGLAAGVYHFGPGDFSLRRLRAGDWRGALARAAADPAIATQPAALVLSAIYWRNTWKYGARGYRHLFWDSGSMLSQLLAGARALDLPARLVTGFVDAEVDALLGLDASKEGALVIASLGVPGPPAPAPTTISPLALATVPLSPREVDYPLLREAYDASSLVTASEVTAWRTAGGHTGGGQVLHSDISPAHPPRSRSIGETIARRGSTREFSGEAIGRDALMAALDHACGPIPMEVPDEFVTLYVNVHAVDGLEPGAHVYDQGRRTLLPLCAGDMRRTSAFLCLEQALGGTSSATVFFLSDLDRILAAWGNRGYRLANLEAGLRGGRLYLAAYAQGFGATGLTFYDRAVVDFFSPHAAGRDAIFVTALGRSRPRGA